MDFIEERNNWPHAGMMLKTNRIVLKASIIQCNANTIHHKLNLKPNINELINENGINDIKYPQLNDAGWMHSNVFQSD